MTDALEPQAWVGRVETRTGALPPELALLLASALAHPAAAPVATHSGAPLPPLWHWAAFPDVAPIDALGTDGHPRLGGFLPPLPFPRRMWAGGRVTFAGRLSVGERLHRRSEIQRVEFKTGATGDMAFVTVIHHVRGEGGGTVRDEQDLVYLPMPTAYRPPRALAPPAAPVFDETVALGPVSGPVRLFRYSAATMNAHRIHYDRDYAREVEKYPGLVVHGPMQASMLLEAGCRHANRLPVRFTYRGVHPVLADADMHLMGAWDGLGAMDLCTVTRTADGSAHQGMAARLEWS